MRNSKLFTLTTFALVLVFSSGIALAQGQGQGNPPTPPANGPGHPLLKCLKIIQLTDDQQAQIKAILQTEKPKLEALHTQIVADRQALKTAIEAVPQDNCAIGAALVKVGADKKAIEAEHQFIRTSVEALLTSEQLAKLQGCLQAPKDAVVPTSEDDEI